MNSNQKNFALAIGSAIALSITAGTANAANPFAAKPLTSGYQVADADMKDKEGKCSASMRAEAQKTAKEGKCSAEKMKDGNCHADKTIEGSCSADKMKDGSCHAQKK